MNIFSPNCLSPAMQLDKNTQDIKTLFANQPQIYYTSEDLDASDTTTPLSTTDITDVDNIGNQPILISANGRLYKITSIVDSTVYCKYEATLPQGDGFNFTGSWVSGNEYHKNDVVTYTSNNITTAYILITNSLSGSTTPPPLDTTNWTVFTSGGLSNWSTTIKQYETFEECYNDLVSVFQRNPAAKVGIISTEATGITSTEGFIVRGKSGESPTISQENANQYVLLSSSYPIWFVYNALVKNSNYDLLILSGNYGSINYEIAIAKTDLSIGTTIVRVMASQYYFYNRQCVVTDDQLKNLQFYIHTN